MVRIARRLALVILILSAGCAEPPNKEMNLAQGAIEAARAAGADRFAAAEFTAAVGALGRSHEAAASGDYRQSLSHALDSFERAQSAAKLSVQGRAQARSEAERVVSRATTLLATAKAKLRGSPPTTPGLTALRQSVESAGLALQEAGSAWEKEDYSAVGTALAGVEARLQAALAQIDPTPPRAPARRKR